MTGSSELRSGPATGGESAAAVRRGDSKRVALAGGFAMLAAPLSAVVTYAVVGEWRVDGPASLLPLVFIAGVGAAAAAYAGRAPLAVGGLAGWVFALWALPQLPGAVAVLGAGVAGGWLVSRSRPMASASDASYRSLGIVAAAGLPVMLALTAVLTAMGDGREDLGAAASVEHDPWCPPSLVATEHAGVEVGPLRVQSTTAGKPVPISGRSHIERSDVFRPLPGARSYEVRHYLVVREATGGGPVWAVQAGGAGGTGDGAGRPTGLLSVGLGADFDGRECLGGEPGQRFTESALPGEYTAQGLFVLGEQVWASEQVSFELLSPE